MQTNILTSKRITERHASATANGAFFPRVSARDVLIWVKESDLYKEAPVDRCLPDSDLVLGFRI